MEHTITGSPHFEKLIQLEQVMETVYLLDDKDE